MGGGQSPYGYVFGKLKIVKIFFLSHYLSKKQYFHEV